MIGICQPSIKNVGFSEHFPVHRMESLLIGLSFTKPLSAVCFYTLLYFSSRPFPDVS